MKKPPKKPGERKFRVLKGDMPPANEPKPKDPAEAFGDFLSAAFDPSPTRIRLQNQQARFENRRLWRDSLFAQLITDPVMLVSTDEEIKRLRTRAWRLAGEFADFMIASNDAERVAEAKALAPLREQVMKEQQQQPPSPPSEGA